MVRFPAPGFPYGKPHLVLLYVPAPHRYPRTYGSQGLCFVPGENRMLFEPVPDTVPMMVAPQDQRAQTRWCAVPVS